MRRTVALILSVLIIAVLSTEAFADAKSAVLIDAESGRVLFSHNKDERLPMASTTKIMTALIALEQTDADKSFAVKASDVAVEGSSMGLLPGDKVTLRILAQGMLLASGNDAANAAAVRVADSVPAFIKLMNERARELGLKNTSFMTPSGLDGEKHYSTAYDMAMLAREALKNPDFAEICGKTSIAAEYGNPPYKRWLSNHNRLLKSLEGATGVKTGFTKKAGRCLVSSAERDGVSLICATLSCPDDWDYHTKLYNDYFALLKSFELEHLVPATAVPVTGGTANSVVLYAKPVSASLFAEEEEDIRVVLSTEPFLFAPVESKTVVGWAYFYSDSVLIAKTPLLTKNSVDVKQYKKGFWQKITDKFGF